jgi:hypothetical protein
MRPLHSVLLALAAVAGIAAWSQAARPDALQAATTAQEAAGTPERVADDLAEPPSVRIDSELIRVTPIRTPSRPAARQAEPARPAPAVHRAQRSRLARFLLGNGHYKPQPFPTPGG